LLSSWAKGQQLVGVLRAGYSTFSMQDLKDYQSALSTMQAFQPQVVSSFPGFLDYGADVLFTHPKFFGGVGLGHTSTGGRVSYGDYSGTYTNDLTVHMTYANIQAGIRVFDAGETHFYLAMRSSLYYNKLDVVNKLDLNSTVDNDYRYSMHSINMAFQPFMSVQRNIKKLFLKFDAGYEVHYAGDLTADDNYNLFNGTDKTKITPNGLRLSLGVGYVIRAF
jgi:hypothetical protein